MEHLERLHLDDTFSFSCHPGVACFNECCRDLNQYLTPYDILRLKNRLDLSSQEFLDQYTVSHIGPRSGLPVISLKLRAEEELRCPFVELKGCAVYEDRPGSCRTYPLGRIAVKRPGGGACEESYVLIREPHCLGFEESKTWTVRRWKQDQELDTYNEMNDLMLDILSLKNRSGRRHLTEGENALFSLACYDLDHFREFTFAGRLWAPLSLEESMVEKMRQDDTALMLFGMAWIKRTLFGHGLSAGPPSLE